MCASGIANKNGSRDKQKALDGTAWYGTLNLRPTLDLTPYLGREDGVRHNSVPHDTDTRVIGRSQVPDLPRPCHAMPCSQGPVVARGEVGAKDIGQRTPDADQNST